MECKSSTLQESDVCEQGTYPVYSANGIVGYLDNYNTEGEVVYIIKDGSGVGTVSYVKGKCSATGTLNILQAKEGYSAPIPLLSAESIQLSTVQDRYGYTSHIFQGLWKSQGILPIIYRTTPICSIVVCNR